MILFFSHLRGATTVAKEDGSLSLFKMTIRASKDRQDYIEAAKQYLEREGFIVTKKATEE